MPDVAATAAEGVGSTHRVNPLGLQDGHDQAQLRTGISAILTIGGQRPVDGQGRLLHEGDTAAQLALALANVVEVVVAAGMTLTELAYLRICTTDLPGLLDVQFVVDEHLAQHGATPPISIVEVSRLAIAGMDLEIDGLAISTSHPTERLPR